MQTPPLLLIIKPASSGPQTHSTSGALAAAGATASGSAARAHVHAASGALMGPTVALSGTATRFRAHAVSGNVDAQGSDLDGGSTRFRAHPASGTLPGHAAALVGNASIVVPFHDASGMLIGQGSRVAGAAAKKEQATNAFGTHPLRMEDIPIHVRTSGRLIGGRGAMKGSAYVTKTGQNKLALLLLSA